MASGEKAKHIERNDLLFVITTDEQEREEMKRDKNGDRRWGWTETRLCRTVCCVREVLQATY